MNPIMPMWFEVAVLLPLILHFFLLVALISVGRTSRHTSAAKGVWVIIILAVPFLGPILWFLIGRSATPGIEAQSRSSAN
ncbi:PLDc N-terminal domain-containing protein [Arthrobacter castelli]|uniref:PLDc N-terminal domain-containing protein n=1 Tax=Arthrobacter castelli TaxID=271431 RepID=UPI000412B5BB|nr:PLDc N-terminal domain-containing protein [Arthrobacter castelli]